MKKFAQQGSSFGESCRSLARARSVRAYVAGFGTAGSTTTASGVVSGAGKAVGGALGALGALGH